jgi:hypothetical protein
MPNKLKLLTQPKARTLTYDEVMLDWAIAELMSDSWDSFWSDPICDNVRSKIQRSGKDSLSVYEQTWLIGSIIQIRNPIISVYGPSRSWNFCRKTVSPQELAQFAITHHFGYLSYSFGNLADKLKNNPFGREKDMQRAVLKIMKQSEQKPIGLPIALMREDPMPPVLLEGYKRAMARVWDEKCTSIEIYLCSPKPFTA